MSHKQNEQELYEFRELLKPFRVDESMHDKPFFAKKVMREIAIIEGQKRVYSQSTYFYLRIALFMVLLLFPTLTEAII